ncbi:hypothetical protein KAR91_87050 [Candidatus Pacearchaeota archaeon]|nr:hypothetical protein [Candidatus Pacearchaeota archaeon]
MKWLMVTLVFGILGSYFVPYILNMILIRADIETVASGVAGFLIGATIVNLSRFGRFWFAPVLVIMGYVILDPNVIEAAKNCIDTVMAGALKS